MKSSCLPVALLLVLAAVSARAETPFVIVVADPPGVGFNDPTPVEPVGGNPGTTLGEQRLNAFQYAAAVWSSKLESSIPVRIRASFDELPCTSTKGPLAASTEPQVFASKDSDPELVPHVWYPPALANHMNGSVIDPDTEEIIVITNVNLGTRDCLTGSSLYLGLDNHPAGPQSDFVTVLLHEIGHGLGFGPTPHRADFSKFRNRGDIYGQYLYDTAVGKTWNEMTDDERRASSVRTRSLVWNGVNVRKDAPKVLALGGTPNLRITEPASIAGNYYVGTAAFGAAVGSPGASGPIVLALDEANTAGPLTTDACSPLVNASEILGRIALADRGTCNFTVKARNAQAAGAIALVIANNVEYTFPTPLLGTDPEISIPVVHVLYSNGLAFKTVLEKSATITAELGANPALLAGADDAGRPMIFNPNPVKDGSTLSHWDFAMSPNQIMEPAINSDNPRTVEPPYDLTLSALRDLGWFSDFDGVPDGIDECPGSDRGSTLVLQGCDTGITNTTFPNGCRISDYFNPCADPRRSGSYASCAADVTKEIQNRGALKPEDSSRIQACIALPR